MNGAESLIQTALDAGLEICFANPGTTELPIVLALDQEPQLRAVLCLFEGVATGAADGYGRMADKPALTLLHLGPGFANGIAYLHDARRARSPIVNIIGDHATWHLVADAPLTSDIVSLAKPVSAWLRANKNSEELAADTAEAIAAASTSPGKIATLIVPHDCQLGNSSGPASPLAVAAPPKVTDEAITSAAKILRCDQKTALFLGGAALREKGLELAARIAAATDCDLICETFPMRWERGGGLPVIERLPYFPHQAIPMLRPYQNIILAGARSPVSFFGYPGVPSYFISPEQNTALLATVDDDVVAALEALAEAVNAPLTIESKSDDLSLSLPTGPLTVENFGAVIAATQPEGAIVMDESNTSGFKYAALASRAARHTVLTQPGGAIGLGPPCATGAAIACPDRAVINIQADGSAMYTFQALWTQAREQLNVTTLICNNRSYRILGVEMKIAGVENLGPQSSNLISLGNPALDWVKMAESLGVPGVKVETADDLRLQLERAIAEPGPHLIEMIL